MTVNGRRGHASPVGGVPGPGRSDGVGDVGWVGDTDGVGEDVFRHVLGRYPAGVVLVTGLGPNGPVGLCVSSFTSVSLSPPLVSFCVAHTSTTWPLLRGGPGLCFTILGEHRQQTAMQFAAPGDRFRGITWQPSPAGLPIPDGGLGWLECTIAAEYGAGDHDIVLCHVHHLGVTDTAEHPAPLLRFHGRYGGFSELPGDMRS